MDKVTLALLLISVVHLVGAGLLVALLFERRDDWRQWWPGDGGGGGDDPPPSDEPGGPPLGTASPADVRLRTSHDRLGRRGGRVRSAPEPSRSPARTAPGERQRAS